MNEEQSAGAGDDEFARALRQFQQDFARQLPERLAEAQAWFTACLQRPADAEPVRELHRVLHRLSGSAGTFGMPQLGADAKTLEALLEDLQAQPARTPASFDAIGAGLLQLQRSVAA